MNLKSGVLLLGIVALILNLEAVRQQSQSASADEPKPVPPAAKPFEPDPTEFEKAPEWNEKGELSTEFPVYKTWGEWSVAHPSHKFMQWKVLKKFPNGYFGYMGTSSEVLLIDEKTDTVWLNPETLVFSGTRPAYSVGVSVGPTGCHVFLPPEFKPMHGSKPVGWLSAELLKKPSTGK